VLCAVTRYTRVVIASFSHKGLAVFYETGSARGIVPQHARRLRLILTTLDDATSPADVDLPAFGLHPLKGSRTGMFSVRVNGNWRVIFAFEGEDVVLVDYLDYH
jgi:toxin HigB-1